MSYDQSSLCNNLACQLFTLIYIKAWENYCGRGSFIFVIHA
jgi:hypothetical protein